METGTKQAAQGWLDIIKSKIKTLTQQFEFSWANATEYGAALVGGIVIGFLVGRYGRITILIIIALAAFLMGLVYFDFITIDWVKVKELVGFAPADTFEAFFKDYLQWAQAHIVAVIISIIGFIIGYKIG